MITPIEIQNKSFKSGGLGYDKKDVDQFMHEILLNYEAIYRENVQLQDKISTLTQGIQYYKSMEKTLQRALVLAEKTAEETKQAAVIKAKNIENEAIANSKMILADAKNELDYIHKQTIAIIQQYDKYKAQFKNLAATQMELLEGDSFSIHVANLDAFIPKSDSKTNFDTAGFLHEETKKSVELKEMEEFDDHNYNELEDEGLNEFSFIDLED